MLPRSGSFRIRSPGVTATADSLTGYWQVPGRQQQFAHPGGGDVCTSVTLSAALWYEATGGRDEPGAPLVHVDGRIAVQHRLLLRHSARVDVAFEGAERLVGLLRACLGGQAVDADRTAPATAASRAMVDGARQAILASHPAADSLISLALHLGTSPSHLSRCFRRDVGVGPTRYRNRVRIDRALSRIDEGAADLAVLAVELGFADQAHLIRTARMETGYTPGALRTLLGARPCP